MLGHMITSHTRSAGRTDPADRTDRTDRSVHRSARVDRTDRRRWLQVPLGIVLFLLAQLLMLAIALAGSVLAGSDLSSGPDAWAQLLGACVGSAAALGGYLLLVGPLGRRPGLGLRGRGKLAELAAGLALGAVLICLSVGVIALLGGYRVTGLAASPQLLAPLAIGIGAGFMEEILFRGVLLRVLDAWLGSWAALTITSLLFGLVHLGNEGASLASALGLVVEAGILLGAAYLLTRRLWFAIGIHIAWNTLQGGVFSSSISGTGAHTGLFETSASGPAWLTGGSMGIEGSVVTVLIGLGTGIVLLVLAARRGHLLPRVRIADADQAIGTTRAAEGPRVAGEPRTAAASRIAAAPQSAGVAKPPLDSSS